MPLMLRVMLLVAIVLLVWRLLRHLLRPLEPHEREPGPLGASEPCPYCDRIVPRNELTGDPPRCEHCRANDTAE